MSKMKNKIFVLVAMTGGICLGIAGISVSQQSTVSALAPPVTHSPSDLSLAFREVSQRVLPAVVSISVESRVREVTQTRNFSPQEEELFRRFFGGGEDRFNEMFKSPRTPQKQVGTGSGFIVNSDGTILTNSHVVEGADRVVVRLADGREIEAASWDFDPRSDVAVVRIDVKEPLPFVTLGESDAMQIGDWVLALGNPLNVGTTVTAGIVSATERAPGINERESYIQTDAAINPGNSGGPLVNLHGEVIGINTAISSRSGGYDGIGFAIPSTMVRWIADQLIDTGVVKRSYLGVQLQQISNDLREQLNVPRGQGALIADVMAGTPAAKAGLEPGDIIMKFSDQNIVDRDDLVEIVERSKPSKTYKALVLRDGKSKTISVKLETMPGDYTPAMQRGLKKSRPVDETEEIAMNALGIEVVEIDEATAKQLGLEGVTSGIAVRSVKAGSPAGEAGLRAGDLIQRVGTTPVNSLKEFSDAIEKTSLSEGVLLHLKRQGGSAFVVLKE